VTRRHLQTTLVALLCVSAWAPAALANYQVRGVFQYRDRPFQLGGFTGATVDLPIRQAEVDVIDDANVVLGSGVTDATGEFAITIIDTQVRNVRVRCKTIAPSASTLELRVLQTVSNAIFAVVSNTYSNHNPNTDIDFRATPVIALPSAFPATVRAGDPFNVFDNALDAMDMVADLRGSRPTQLLTIYWDLGSGNGTYYSPGTRSIYLYGLMSDSDGYDDTVILHEVGHYIEDTLGATDNPGGPHSLNELYDLRLSWSEGFGTFFQNMVRSWKGQARPEIYVDTSGEPGPGHAFISYEVETPSVGVPTARNEVSVNAVLWDIVDVASTPDGSVGSDDDALALADGRAEFWQAFTSSQFRTAANISAEDFWDAWFAVGNNEAAAMQAIFNARGIEYNDDAFEQDDGVAQARSVVAGSPSGHRTFYGAGDDDWIVVAVQGGSPYTFETLNLTNGADTRLDLYASNGVTLLANNDNAPGGGPESRIDYMPAQTSVVYLRCRRVVDMHNYGSYDLRVVGTGVPVEVSDVAVTAVEGGVRLQWRARRDGGFSHFEIERGDAAADAGEAFAVLGRADEPAGGGELWEFVDRTATAGRTYAYRLVGVETSGEREVFGPFLAAAPVPARLALRPPHPNPFNPTTVLGFELPHSQRVWLRVYNSAGAHVRTLVAGETLAAGHHDRVWDGRDDRGRNVASGVYVVHVDAGGERTAVRAVLVR